MLTPEQQLELAAKKGVNADTVQLCEYERPTGSNIPEWRCRYLNDRERERFAAQKALLEVHGTGSPPRRPGSSGP